ncbi:MAG: class II fructose-bisphosphate aldolase [Lachnospiraceae bacterium]|jgi:ketose-bisphosphate aldolase|nr:class II fructose-bisphosphate aldolase [Lachnospiraceae bacterium]
MICSIKDMVNKAYEGHYAVPAFNTQGGNYDITQAICQAAEESRSPIILAHYDTCSDYAGLDFFVEISKWCANKVTVPVAIHLDHGSSVELCKRAIDLGCSSVMYDGSALPLEDNAENAKTIIKYAAERGVSVECEIGRMLSSMENAAVAENCARIEDVLAFLELVRPDALAVAIGNAHGFYTEKPVLNFRLLEQIGEKTQMPLVLHGGTGIPEEDVQKGISLGIAKVNIGTEIRCNYVQYLYEGIEQMGMTEHAWKIEKKAIARMVSDIKEKIVMCGSGNRI